MGIAEKMAPLGNGMAPRFKRLERPGYQTIPTARDKRFYYLGKHIAPFQQPLIPEVGPLICGVLCGAMPARLLVGHRRQGTLELGYRQSRRLGKRTLRLR